jgi:ubiquinone/menaquinone biosynthesis C-methylase UbiE
VEERTGGIWALLKHANCYTALQNLLGGPQLRQLIVDNFIRAVPGDRVLDVGCGPADFAPLMPKVNYLGIDRNPDYIRQARKRYGDRARFLRADVSTEPSQIDGNFNVIIAIGLLHHLTDEQSISLLAATQRHLAPAGRLLTIDPARTPSQNWIAKLIINVDRGRHVRSASQYEALARTSYDEVTVEVRTDLLRVPYTHCILECRNCA